MKPYSEQGLTHDKRIFNYQLSRERRIVESAFGILANRFRVLLGSINLSAPKVELIILTCVLLHNYLVTKNQNKYTELNNNFEELRRIGRQAGNRSANTTREVREYFKKYFNSAICSIP